MVTWKLWGVIRTMQGYLFTGLNRLYSKPFSSFSVYVHMFPVLLSMELWTVPGRTLNLYNAWWVFLVGGITMKNVYLCVEIMDFGYPQNLSPEILKLYITQEGVRSPFSSKVSACSFHFNFSKQVQKCNCLLKDTYLLSFHACALIVVYFTNHVFFQIIFKSTCNGLRMS